MDNPPHFARRRRIARQRQRGRELAVVPAALDIDAAA